MQNAQSKQQKQYENVFIQIKNVKISEMFLNSTFPFWNKNINKKYWQVKLQEKITQQ